MHLFTMLRFQDLFVGQIIGILINRKYTGMINFLPENERAATSIWLNANGVTHVQREAATGKDPLHAIFWHTKGKIGLYPKVFPPSLPPINFAEATETAVTKMSSPLTNHPMLENIYLQRDILKMEKQNTAIANSSDMLRRISASGIEVAKLRSLAAWTTFWPTLHYLCSDGRVICSYDKTLGNLLKTFELNLTTRLTSLFGARALVPFNTAVQEILQEQWPDWTMGELPDALYGAAPYYLWTKTLKEKVSMVGIPTLTQRCFDQTIDKLTKTDIDLIRYLLQ